MTQKPLRAAAVTATLFIAGQMPVLAADPEEDLFELDALRVKITESLPYLVVPHQGKQVTVMRRQDPAHRIDAPYDRTTRPCPPYCIQPMQLAPGVATIGELELLAVLGRIAKGDEDVLVVDSRTPDWVARGTIPGSINIPFTKLDPAHADPKAIAELLQLEFGAVSEDGLWNFAPAKHVVLFCNGAWCGQSPTNIRALLNLGYPAHKLSWYRGGMQAWEQFGLTTVKPEQ